MCVNDNPKYGIYTSYGGHLCEEMDKNYAVLFTSYFNYRKYYFLTWSQFTYKPTQEALSLVDDKKMKIISFWSERCESRGYFYQGAKVEAEAYSYLGEALAKDGHFVVMPKLPLNLAIFGINEVDSVIEKYPEVQKWYVAGHSMGGAMISKYASQHEDKVHGIIFLGSYPADDFSTKSIPMLSIYGEVDALATLEK